MVDLQFFGRLNDMRLEKRGLEIAERMCSKQTAVLNQISECRSELVGYSRFLNNPKVSYQKMKGPVIEQTAKACVGKHVLAIQDTTEFNFEHHVGLLSRLDRELGPTGNDKDIGFFTHPTIAIDKEDEMLLGTSDVHIWNRQYDKQDKIERDYSSKPIEEKESYRWIECSQRSKEVLKDAASVLFIADREADIYEEFCRVPDERCDILIRSKADRRLYQRKEKLYSYLQSRPKAGEISLKVRPTAHRKARMAKLEVRTADVQVARPKSKADNSHLPEYMELNVIYVEETPESVPEKEDPIRWILLTTCAVNDMEDALELIRCYSLRWQIELVFGTMKSKGLDIEASQLETGRALKSLTIVAFNTALRINQLRLARNDQTDTPASIVFTAQQIKLLHKVCKQKEGRTKKQKNPHTRETMAWAAWIIGRLGGWKGYKSESPPGNKTLCIGWKDFMRLYEGWSLAQINTE